MTRKNCISIHFDLTNWVEKTVKSRTPNRFELFFYPQLISLIIHSIIPAVVFRYKIPENAF